MTFFKNNLFIFISLIISVGIIYMTFNTYFSNLINFNFFKNKISGFNNNSNLNSLTNEVVPKQGVVLPVIWGDLGQKLINSGVIDKVKFEAIYANQGGLTKDEADLLDSINNSNLKITRENSAVILNLFWALGLANKNEILEKGPMADSRFGGAGNFASTGGWTISKTTAMDYYNKLNLISLTPAQQNLVEKISQNIYRPCCNNPTHFPDCNHGMAMLGFLELAASQGMNEAELYKYALALNSYWFEEAYLTIGELFNQQGVSWDKINPEQILGSDFSSASGYQKVLSQVAPVQFEPGGSCGV